MKDKHELMQLEQRQDQDVARGVKWWREASAKDKFRVWDEIQKSHNDPVKEIVSRFAQVGATHIALLAGQESK